MNGVNKVAVGWAIGVAVILLLMRLAAYNGYGKHPGERTPGGAMQTQR